MKAFLRSIAKSFKDAVLANEYYVRFADKHPDFAAFSLKRLSRQAVYGRVFSLSLLLAVLMFFYFLAIAEDIITRDSFLEADIRIMNMWSVLRSINMARFLLLFTYLGNWQVVLSLSLVVVAILLALNQRRQAKYFLTGIAASELVYFIAKLLIQRTRPDASFALITSSGYAFPSGHATVTIVLYGLIGFGLYRLFRRNLLKVIVTLITLWVILFIGFSRVYLGVHWTSDVIAGWFLGLAILASVCALYTERERIAPEKKQARVLPRKFVAGITTSLLLLEIIFISYFYHIHPIKTSSPVKHGELYAIANYSDLPGVLRSDQFPKYSETLVGNRMEPISIVVVGSREKLVKAFESAGWFAALKPTISTVVPLAIDAIFNRPYPNAPMTPSFLNAEPDAIGFQKPTPDNTARDRHHTRFWSTDYTLNGVPIWVATASLDNGIRYLITHKIQPDIDTEREYIKNDLVGTGAVAKTEQIQLVETYLGKNQSGDQFYTDGKADIIILK